MVDSGHRDPAFPQLHGRPSVGWVNDPNGLSRVDGRYHVFFQYNPDSARHAGIKWGHASSADLVRWTQEPLALVNRPGELDQYGCWTGCLVDDGGVPTAVYSAVADDSGRSEVMLATSDREMREWTQERRSVLGMPADAAVTDVRDPFVFEFEGHRYAVQGAGHSAGAPRILLYGCDDLHDWTELGPLLTAHAPVASELPPANIWECPNLVRIDDRWVLVFSLWRRVAGEVVLDSVRYLMGDLVLQAGMPRFSPESSGLLDTGPCFYAPQLLALPGRTLMWAWARESGRTTDEIDRAGWAGTLTFCRELSVVEGVVMSQPATELAALRREPLEVIPGRTFSASAFELQPDLDSPAAFGSEMSLWLVDEGSQLLVAEWTFRAGRSDEPRVLVDGSLVEIFDGGPTVHTCRAYPTWTSGWEVRTSQPQTPVTLRGWRLG